MSTTTTTIDSSETIDFSELGMRVNDEGLTSVVATLRPEGAHLAARARCAGVAPAGIDVIEDAAASDVLWLRAYVAVHAALATTRPVFELVA